MGERRYGSRRSYQMAEAGCSSQLQQRRCEAGKGGGVRARNRKRRIHTDQERVTAQPAFRPVCYCIHRCPHSRPLIRLTRDCTCGRRSLEPINAPRSQDCPCVQSLTLSEPCNQALPAMQGCQQRFECATIVCCICQSCEHWNYGARSMRNDGVHERLLLWLPVAVGAKSPPSRSPGCSRPPQSRGWAATNLLKSRRACLVVSRGRCLCTLEEAWRLRLDLLVFISLFFFLASRPRALCGTPA